MGLAAVLASGHPFKDPVAYGSRRIFPDAPVSHTGSDIIPYGRSVTPAFHELIEASR